MPAHHHRRYYIRFRTAVAGSLIAAASLTGVGVAPSVAASSTVTNPQDAPSDRLDGVRSELEDAVVWGLVTAEQAEKFYAQIQRRVASGG